MTTTADDAARTHTLKAPEGAGRLDRFLAERLDLSRSRLQALIRAGEITVDGMPTTRPSHALEGGEVVVVGLPPPEPSGLVAQDIPLPILHLDAHLIVVDKPPEMVVHPARGHRDGTLVNALLHHLGAAGGDPERPGIVHRLDRGTSGTMVVARTEATHADLAAQFAARTVHRRYLALVWGRPNDARGTIDAPHGRHPRDRLRFAVVGAEHGRRAVTHYRVFGAGRLPGGDGREVALVGCRLETGRTHQIRVHLAHIGHPLVGDALYGPNRQPPALLRDKPEVFQQLHAARLGFRHPATGEEVSFEAPPPPPFRDLAAALGLEVPGGAALASAW